MRHAWAFLASGLLVLGGAAAIAGLGACGTDATGIETCRQIETARCQRAPSCNVSLAIPVHRDSPQTDVDACIRWYHDACEHGLEVTDPGAPAAQACVSAIQTASCDVVLHPEANAACAWLQPSPADAGPDATDGAPDATADANDGAASSDAGTD